MKAKITCYDLRINKVSRKIGLIKEKAFEYSGEHFNEPGKVAKFIAKTIGAESFYEERAHIIALNLAGEIVGVFELSRGRLDSSSVGVKEIFTRLLLCRASAFIFTHNHPSGTAMPSENDIKFTNDMIKAAKTMEIKFLDHIITTSGSNYYSFKNAQRI